VQVTCASAKFKQESCRLKVAYFDGHYCIVNADLTKSTIMFVGEQKTKVKIAKSLVLQQGRSGEKQSLG